MKTSLSLKLVAAAAVLVCAAGAQAAGMTSDTGTVMANVTSACGSVTAPDLDFTSVAQGAAKSVGGNVSADCGAGAVYNLTYTGTGPSNSFLMTSTTSGDTLAYTLNEGSVSNLTCGGSAITAGTSKPHVASSTGSVASNANLTAICAAVVGTDTNNALPADDYKDTLTVLLTY